MDAAGAAVTSVGKSSSRSHLDGLLMSPVARRSPLPTLDWGGELGNVDELAGNEWSLSSLHGLCFDDPMPGEELELGFMRLNAETGARHCKEEHELDNSA